MSEPSICTNCGANWSAGQSKPECPQCGGFAMELPCPMCGGKCGAIYQRAVHDSQDSNLAHWAGRCLLPPDQQAALRATYILRGVLDQINAVGAWDYRLEGYDGLNLTIRSGCTLDHPESWLAEIVLSGVVYIDCPVNFSHARFELATADEIARIEKTVAVEQTDRVIAITAETQGYELTLKRFFIVAERASLKKRPSK
jgi:hypothetical protein